MAYTLVDKAIAASSGGSGYTTSAINSTGATFAAIYLGFLTNQPTLSDSKGNTYVQKGTTLTVSNMNYQVWECEAPVVGSGHTATITSTNGYSTASFSTFSGSAVPAFDQFNKTSGLSVSSQPIGTITPTAPNELVLCGVYFDTSQSGVAPTLTGYTLVNWTDVSGGNHNGMAVFYKVQTAPASTASDSYTLNVSSGNVLSVVASFKSPATANFFFAR